MSLNTSLLGRKIKALRHYLGLSQEGFAEKLGRSSETILNWEKGKTVPRDKSIELICQVYNVHPGWFKEEGALPLPGNPQAELSILALAELADLDDLQGPPPEGDLALNMGRGAGAAVRAEGDSMSPTILDGSLAGVDFSSREPVDNGIFLVRFTAGCALRRLRFRADGYIAVADNREGVERLEDGLILGRVKWVCNEF